MSLMNYPDEFFLDGKTYSQNGLKDFCTESLRDSSTPGWKKEVLSFMDLFLNPTKGRVFQETSGTTGEPRVYELHQKSMICSAQRTLKYFNLRPGHRLLLCLPVKYIAGKLMVIRALVGGLDLVMVEPSSRPLLGFDNSITLGAMVPLQVFETLKHKDPFWKIEKLIVGGGALHPSTKKDLQKVECPEVFESFAMTETYTHFALKKVNGKQKEREFKLLEGVIISQDNRGCLQVEVPGVTTGLISTNDLVKINASGNGFKWLGRIDNVINSGGIKIVPELLEEKLQELLGFHCLILQEEDIKLGERLVLMIEGAENAQREGWTALLQEHLSPYEIPKRIVLIKKLPRNRNLKPDRKAAHKVLLDLQGP